MKLTLGLLAATVLAPAGPPTFYRDVLPILQARCQSCHRTGEAAPMPLTTYKEVRPYARAMQAAVVSRIMPPWFAASAPHAFANDPRLTTAEIAVFRNWARGGAPAGSSEQAPPVRQWSAGWRIGAPDVVFVPSAFIEVPASGALDYQHILLPTHFTEDRWVQAIEVRPSNRAVVHHAVVFVRPPRSIWLRNHPYDQPFTTKGSGLQGLSALDEVLDAYLPGADPHVLPPGHGKLIPKGSDLILQIHYTAKGQAAQDRTSVGLIFAREKPANRVYSLSVAQGVFAIPPGNAAYPVETEFKLQTPTQAYALTAHMHLRGKSMRVSAVTETDDEIELLNVPHFDFNWQLVYRPTKPIALARGTKIRVEAVFDNSPNNPRNPDPAATVRWGEQSWEEMVVCFLDFILPAGISPNELFRAPRLGR